VQGTAGRARPLAPAPAGVEGPGPSSVSWKIHREVALLLGWGSAILMQFAHPLVAQGVAEHSGFRTGAREPWRRLHRTLGAMLAMTFGPPDAAARAVAGINAIHDRVHGVLPAAVGRHPAGTRYSARDPALLTWVHATCLDGFMRAHETFVGPLGAGERDRYCEESAAVEGLLGIPPGTVPRTAAALDGYLEAMMASGEIAVGPTAQALAGDLLAPPGLRLAPPLVWGVRLTAVGLLPPSIRRAYDFRWERRHERALRACAAGVRALLAVTPGALRHWPRARAAARRARGAPAPML
jgi:uncharacterized protein (DUF2236 family)